MNIDDFRFVTEAKNFAINLVTGEIVDDADSLKQIKKAGHHSLEWRGNLEANRDLVDRILADVDVQIRTTATTWTFDKSMVDDTAQEIRLFVVDVVLKNSDKSYDELLAFVTYCINNFARRVFRSMDKEKRDNPAISAVPLFSVDASDTRTGNNAGLSEKLGLSFDGKIYFDSRLIPEYMYDPIVELQWEELKEVVAKHLTRIQRRVFNFVVENPDMTEEEVAERLGYADQSGVNHILSRIREKVKELISLGVLDLS